MKQDFHVKKRNNRLQKLDINKVNICAQRACENLEDVSASEVVIDANVQLYNKIPTKEIDRALIMSARTKIEKEPNYSYVAARFYWEIFTKKSLDVALIRMRLTISID